VNRSSSSGGGSYLLEIGAQHFFRWCLRNFNGLPGMRREADAEDTKQII
jgi:hypothetical protein